MRSGLIESQKLWVERTRKRLTGIRSVGVAALFLLILGVLLGRLISAPVSRDEYQFVAAGQFFHAQTLLPYRDYPFLHMPYLPILNGLPLVFGGDDFLTVRLFSEMFIFLSFIVLFALVYRLFNGGAALAAGTLAVLILISDPSFLNIDGRALNHSQPLLLSLGVLWVYQVFSRRHTRQAAVLVGGLLVGVAVGIRLSFLVLIVPLVFALLFDPWYTAWREKLRSLIMLGIGLGVALLPAGIFFLIAPRPFIYGNFYYIRLNTLYRSNLGFEGSMTIAEKLRYFYTTISTDPAALLLYGSMIVLLVTAALVYRRRRERGAFFVGLIYAFAIVLLAAGFSPTPLWPQYFFAPVPFLILGLFSGLSQFMRCHPRRLAAALGVIFVILMLRQPFSVTTIPWSQLADPQTWTTTQSQRLGEKIRAASRCDQDCKILTLRPILPLGADMQTYPMFTVGSFSWRTAPLLSKERRAAYGIISYEDLEEFLQADPPDAILTGTEATYERFTVDDPDGLDQPFIDYAQKYDYQPILLAPDPNDASRMLTLWIR